MRTVKLLVLGGLVSLLFMNARSGSSQSAQTAGIEIPLTVNEWSNIARTNEPVTSGVPIPASATGAAWALFDGATEIPLQTTLLPGLKTPWVLLDFQTSISTGQTRSLTLREQTPTVVPNQPLTYSEDASQITVTTGTFRTQLSKTNFNLLDTVWLDSNGNGAFENGERVVFPAVNSNITVNDVGSGQQFSGRGTPDTVAWEYQGPLRATLKVEGSYKNGGTTLLTYTTRLTWYAGQTFVKIEHLIRNSFAAQERWVKLSSAKLNVGTSTTTNRIARSGDTVWSNVTSGSGASVELLPASVTISDEYAPYAKPPIERVQETLNVDTNGGMIIGDLSYHGATVQLDFAAGLSATEKTRRTTVFKDPLIALAPEQQYSDLGAFGSQRFGTYTDEKNAYTKWGWTWPTPSNPWSYEHDRPRVQDIYPSWSVLDATNDPESDDLWQNVVMFSRVRIPFYLDRLRAWARYWKWEWAFRSDGYFFNGSSSNFWYGPNADDRTPVIQPALTENDTDYIEHNIKYGKAGTSHMWNGGILDHYYLTGDRDALQAGIDTAEVCALYFDWRTLPNAGVGGNARFPARCLLVLLRTWEVTDDARWKQRIDRMLPFFLESPWYDERGFYFKDLCENPAWELCQRFPNGKSVSPFMMATVVEALYRYYLLTNDQTVRGRLITMGEFGRDFGVDPVTGFTGDDLVIDSPTPGSVLHLSYDAFRNANPTNLIPYAESTNSFINAMVIAYRLTGDASFLNRAKFYWNQGSKGNYGSRYATDTQVGAFANSLQPWDPYSLLFPEGGDWTGMSLLFYDAARQDTIPPATITDLTAANGSYTITANNRRTPIRPFGSGYRDKLWAKRVELPSPKKTLYFFIPKTKVVNGAIAIYDRHGRRLALEKPFARFAKQGLNADLRVDPLTNKLFLAVGSKDSTARVQVYEVTRKGLRSISTLKPPRLRRNSNVMVKFLKLYPEENGLVSFVPGTSSSITVWRFSPTKKKFVRDTAFNLQRLKLRGERVTHKSS